MSQKGNEKLAVDHYLFICNGKGKPGHANVRYFDGPDSDMEPL